MALQPGEKILNLAEMRARRAKVRAKKQGLYFPNINLPFAVAADAAHRHGLIVLAALVMLQARKKPLVITRGVAEMLGIGQRTARRALSALEQAGLLTVERKEGNKLKVLNLNPPKRSKGSTND